MLSPFNECNKKICTVKKYKRFRNDLNVKILALVYCRINFKRSTKSTLGN